MVNGDQVEEVEEFAYLGASSVDEQAAEGTWCIPEINEGVGNLRNTEENQDTPVQDLSETSPTIWLRNLEACCILYLLYLLYFIFSTYF